MPKRRVGSEQLLSKAEYFCSATDIFLKEKARGAQEPSRSHPGAVAGRIQR